MKCSLQPPCQFLIGTNSFTYDNEGRLATGYGKTYSFDYEHRLTGVSGTGSAETFSYDGAGNRLRATRNGVNTRYVYDMAGNLIAEANTSNVISRYFIHGAGLMAMVKSDNSLYCYHFDATGHTIALTDAGKTVVNKYAYTPFGVITGQTEAIPQPFKYAGQHGVMAESNGLYYMRARYYDPAVKRFISEDPLGFDGGDLNLYAYVGNNPVMFIDPQGTFIFAPALYFAGAKIGAMAIGYVGTKIAQGVANSTGKGSVPNQDINQAFAKVGTINAAEIAAAGAVNIAVAAWPSMTTAVLSNPQSVQNATDFIDGAFSPGPPPPSLSGYLGGAASALYDYRSNK